jgi:hypothetical protein
MTTFYTNIDCAKKLVSKLCPGGDHVHFLVGDRIVLYNAPGTEVVMEVASRTWRHVYGHNPILFVELTLASHFTDITHFEKFMSSIGFPRG